MNESASSRSRILKRLHGIHSQSRFADHPEITEPQSPSWTTEEKISRLKSRMEAVHAEVHCCSDRKFDTVFRRVVDEKSIGSLLCAKNTLLGGRILSLKQSYPEKLPELVKNHTEFDGAALYTLTFVLAMNKDRYDGLSDELKKVLDENSGLEFSVFAGGTQADADGPARQVAVDLGNNIVELNEEETQVWRDASQPIYDSWIADMDSKGIDGQALINEARELMDAYGK